jgi:membrane protease YdiL (CAAX protease family)
MREHPLAAYFVLAYTLSWAVHVPLALSAQGLLPVTLAPGFHLAGAYGPALAAFGVTAVTEGTAGLRDLLRRIRCWRVGVGWLLVAVFSPAVLFLFSVVIVRIWDGVWPDLAQFGYMQEFPNQGWLASWAVWTLTFGLGEEIGWRGFALPRLQKRRGAWVATLILGGLWALWHLPQFFYNYTWHLLGAVAFVASTVSGAIVLTWLYNNTGGSVLVAALWHGAFNTAVAGAQGAVAPLVNVFIILAAVLIVRRSGAEFGRFTQGRDLDAATSARPGDPGRLE